jgi:enediyne biosynthesis thioesterase
MFLRDHAPEVSEEIARGLCLITTRCSCEYLAELSAFDEVVIKMRLADLAQNRITMSFEYWRSAGGNAEEIVARGEQQIVCMQRSGGSGLEPTPIPRGLVDALRSYT